MLYTDAIRIIMALMAVGQQFALSDDPKFGDVRYLSASLTNTCGDLFAFGMGVGDAAQLTGRTEAHTLGDHQLFYQGRLILWAITVLEGLEPLAGFGPPYNGDEFKDSSAELTATSERLGSAFPDDNWQGSAAHGYAGQNANLQDKAQTLADLDSRLAYQLGMSAKQNTNVRLAFGTTKGLLVALYGILMALYPIHAGADATALEFMGAGYAVLAGMLMIVFLAVRADEVAARVQKITDEYNDLATTPPPPGPELRQARLASAVHSTVSGSPTISNVTLTDVFATSRPSATPVRPTSQASSRVDPHPGRRTAPAVEAAELAADGAGADPNAAAGQRVPVSAAPDDAQPLAG